MTTVTLLSSALPDAGVAGPAASAPAIPPSPLLIQLALAGCRRRIGWGGRFAFTTRANRQRSSSLRMGE